MREVTLSVSDTSETTDPSLRLCFLFSRFFWAADLWPCFPLTWVPFSDGGCRALVDGFDCDRFGNPFSRFMLFVSLTD